jgi:hypothetical protein
VGLAFFLPVRLGFTRRNRGFIPMIEAFELVLAISAAYFVVSGAIERLKY